MHQGVRFTRRYQMWYSQQPEEVQAREDSQWTHRISKSNYQLTRANVHRSILSPYLTFNPTKYQTKMWRTARIY